MRFLLPLLLLWGFSALADNNVFPAGGFETPAVTGRTSSDKGGDPSNGGIGPAWVGLELRNSGTGGKVVAGLTGEIAHDGKQSFYVDFQHITDVGHSVILTSNMVVVKPAIPYQVNIWGHTDAKNQISADGRSAYLKLQVDFYNAAVESVGDSIYAVQPLPGSREHDPYFKPGEWANFHVHFITPDGAATAQLTYRWETGSDEGVTNGIMYFDDVSMAELPPEATPTPTPMPSAMRTPLPDVTPEPSPDASGSPKASATPMSYPVNFATPEKAPGQE